MKKIVPAIIFCACFIFNAAFAEDDSINAHINNTLHLLFKITDAKSLMNANNYQQTIFVYKGMPVTAFKNKTSGWVGFFKKLNANDLPENAVSSIRNKYRSYKIENVTIYFNSGGELCYFAEIILKDKCIVLKIQPSGQVKVFG